MDSQPLDREENANIHQDSCGGDTGHEPNQKIPAPIQADIGQDQKRRMYTPGFTQEKMTQFDDEMN